MRGLLFSLSLVAFLLFPLVALGQESVVEKERAKIISEAQALFNARDFAALETMAADFRANRSRSEDGMWKLPFFYEKLYVPAKNTSEVDWNLTFAISDEWKVAFPDSITQPVARANNLVDFAWKARGGGWASAVSAEGWKLFGERLQQARDVLENASMVTRCPEWYRVMQAVAMGQGWDNAKTERLFLEAVQAEPTYYTHYFQHATHLMPYWQGDPGEMEKFAEKAVAYNPAEGMTTYTRIAWSLSGYYINIFKETKFSWPKMKQGFLDIQRQFPDSAWTLNAFCKFAIQAGDLDTARGLVQAIGDQPIPSIWRTLSSFDRAKRLVSDPEFAAKEVTPRRVISAQLGSARAVAFTPDGAQLIVGYAQQAVAIWDNSAPSAIRSFIKSLLMKYADARAVPPSSGDEEKPLRLFDRLGQPVLSVAVSPDGKWLAAAGGDDINETPGLGWVWELSSGKLRTKVDLWKGPGYAVKFSPDGKTLAFAGGKRGGPSEIYLYDVETGKVGPVAWPDPHSHTLTGIAFSPDSKVLLAPCNNDISIREIASGKNLYIPDRYLGAQVHDVLYSPDGQHIVAAVGHDWKNRKKEGAIARWDNVPAPEVPTTPKWVARRPSIPAGSLRCLAMSPDGKVLATGGHREVVQCWDWDTGKELATYYGHTGMIFSVAFSPDGKTVSSASYDGTVRLWDVPTSPEK